MRDRSSREHQHPSRAIRECTDSDIRPDGAVRSWLPACADDYGLQIVYEFEHVNALLRSVAEQVRLVIVPIMSNENGWFAHTRNFGGVLS